MRRTVVNLIMLLPLIRVHRTDLMFDYLHAMQIYQDIVGLMAPDGFSDSKPTTKKSNK